VTADAWARLAKTLAADQPAGEYLVDLPYADVLAHADQVTARLDRLFAAEPADYWLDLLQGAGIWCTKANTLADLLTDEQVAANSYLSTLDDGLRTVAMPFTLSGYAAPTRGGRAQGADNEEIFTA
jgi:crotonobetainyl-CoA:carnitine CoA-transferase CaiB-like acyl-CoA transferase